MVNEKEKDLAERVLQHDYEFKLLSSNLKNVVVELHELTASLKPIAALTEKINNIDSNLKESFGRVHDKIELNLIDIKYLKERRDKEGCSALEVKSTQIDILNRSIYGKDGRGGLIFEVEDIKKYIHKAMGIFAALNIALAIFLAYI